MNSMGGSFQFATLVITRPGIHPHFAGSFPPGTARHGLARAMLRTEDPIQGFGERVHCGGELESCQFFKFERRLNEG